MDLKLDSDGDLAIENGDLVLISGIDAIAQDCKIRLRFFQGEWFLDTRLGVPWYVEILGQKPKYNVIRSIIQKAILTTPGVVSISDFSIDFDAEQRLLSVAFRGETDEGSFLFDEELLV